MTIMLGWFLLGFFFFAYIAFLSFVPSDNPKSLRSQVQELLKNDWYWRFLVHLSLWGGVPILILLLIWDMSGP